MFFKRTDANNEIFHWNSETMNTEENKTNTLKLYIGYFSSVKTLQNWFQGSQQDRHSKIVALVASEVQNSRQN